MCGILGCVSEGPVLESARLAEMQESLAHRGPDDAGVWRSEDGSVLLGSRRLAILDLSPFGHQPMQDESGSFILVLNGEIYNYVELREELLKKGFQFRSSGDTEVLLAAYRAWGAECLERLNGMFAFAIWDAKAQELFAARDRFGEKPFYYFLDPERKLFLFASEVKTLLLSGLVSPAPNGRSVFRFLVHHEISYDEETFFRGISSLPAAHALKYSRGRGAVQLRRYWDLDPSREVRLRNDRAYSDRLLELLTDAVKIRLRSDVPVGSSLSGGIDSSTVVALVSAQSNGHGRAAFSARFDDPRLDEGPYIQRMAERAKLESHCVFPDPALIPEEIERLTWHHDQPFYSTSVYAAWTVMRLAREKGVVVLLDGQGADEIFAGYHSFFGPYYLDLLKRWRGMSLLKDFYRYLREQGARSLPPALAEALPAELRAGLKNSLQPKALNPEFAAQWGAGPAPWRRRFESPLKDALYRSLARGILPELLHYADRNSMAFSREVRLPYLDHRLAEFMFSLPADQFIRGSTTKVVLRNGIEGLVPEEIRARKDKLGYAPPEAAWLRGPLKPWVEEILYSSRFQNRGWADGKKLARVWEKFLAGRDRWHTLVWRWVSLETWARVFLDRAGRGFAGVQ